MSYYSYIDEEHKNLPLPQKRPNGGLYTGEEAKGNWGAVYVKPEAHVYLTENLLSANPPPNAIKQRIVFTRPGNSETVHPFHTNIVPFNQTFIISQE